MAQSLYKWSNNHEKAQEAFSNPVHQQATVKNTKTVAQSFKTAPGVGQKTSQNKTAAFQKVTSIKPTTKGVGEGKNKINNKPANTLSNYKKDSKLTKRGLR